MSAPTDADREKAAEAWEEARDLGVIEAIAAALAAERDAALAPVLALADTYDGAAAQLADAGDRVLSDICKETADRIRAAIAAPVAQAGEGR